MSSGVDVDRVEIGQKIVRHSQRLETMVTDILDLAKLGSNRFQFNIASYDLSSQLRELSDGWKLLGNEVGIQLEVAAPVNAQVTADPVRVAQILDNLVGNALKFARARIAVSLVSDGSWINVRVADDGPGIKPENVERVFDSYYSLSAHGDSSASGSGLGLAVAKQLATRMGGSLQVESTTSSGSTMLLLLQIV